MDEWKVSLILENGSEPIHIFYLHADFGKK